MATAAALMNTPVAPLAAVDNRLAQADRDRDDHFARLLDSACDERTAETEIGDRASAPAAEAKSPPDEARASSDNTADPGSAGKVTARKAFQAALNSLNVEEGGAAADAAKATPPPETEVAGVTVKPATTTEVQTNSALLTLVSAADTPIDVAATDTTAINAFAALLGAPQPQTAPVVMHSEAEGEGGAVVQATEPDASGAVPLAPDELAGTAETGSDIATGLTPQDTTTSAPASAQAKVQPTAQAAVQAPTPADSAAKAIDDASAPAPPTATQQTTTGNPLSDASRAAATPPALQSAPAATIEVYSRIIERADGRAHRFEVRLDPVELGQVDVRIEIGADKKVHAVLAAHDSASLSDLMRGQRALERALSDAGIDLADNGVRFEMSNDTNRGSANQRQGDPNTRSSQAGVWRNFDTLSMPVSSETAAAVTPMRRTQRLDLVA